MAFQSFHVLNNNVADFLNNLDEYIHELREVKYSLIADTSCIIVYGNEDLYLETYARCMICKHFNVEKKSIKLTEHVGDINYKQSNYHFEIDYNQTHNAFIKSIIKNQNISGNKYVFILKKFATATKQYQLKKLIDSYPNTTFIILAKSINNIDESIKSRALMLRLTFEPTKLKEFLSRHYSITEYDSTMGLLSIIAEVKKAKYEIELEALLNTISKGRNQMDIVAAIKDYCYKIFHMCTPLSHLCKIIIKKYSQSPKIREIIEICAECDHNMVTGTRDILCYEQLFVRLWKVI